MNNIAIFGAGSYGQEIACLIRKINSNIANDTNRWNFIGFFDDSESIWGTDNGYGKILGGINALNKWETPLCLVVAVANVSAIKKIVEKINNPLLSYPNIIDPETSFLDKDTVIMGKGNIVGEGCRFAPKVCIGDFNIIVNDSIFGHDVVVGNCNIFYPAVRLSGHVTVGDNNLFGVRTTVLQRIKIGTDVKISSGSFLMNNAKDGYTYVGNPARRR